MMKRPFLAILAGVSFAACAYAQEATFSVRMMVPETALKAAQAALKKCRDDGYQVTVAVVDRSGITQVVLRDRFAGPHTVRMAVDKAWTAVTFRTSTAEIEKATQPGAPQSGIRHRPRVAAVAGGRGGGKPHMAQAGIPDASRLPQALEEAPAIVRRHLGGASR